MLRLAPGRTLALSAFMLAAGLSVACAKLLGVDEIAYDTAGAGDAAASDGTGGTDAMPIADGGSDVRAPCDDDASVDSDPDNCGGCGHSCLGAPCVAGRCAAIVLASGQQRPIGLAVDDTHVFWSAQGKEGGIMRALLDGGGATLLFHDDVETHLFVALNKANVVWTVTDTQSPAKDAIEFSAKSGKDQRRAHINEPMGIAADGTFAYAAANNVIARTRFVGEITTASPGPLDAPRFVAVSGDSVFFTAANMGMNGYVSTWNAATDMLTFVATAQDAPHGIAADGTHVYWVNSGENAVRAAPQDGGADHVLASQLASPLFVAVDDEFVYWTARGTGPSFADGVVQRIPKDGSCDGGCVETLAENQPYATTIAVGNDAVYWIAEDAGQIMKVAK